VSEALKATFASIDQLFASCSIDYALLANANLTESWLTDYNNQRIVNSFLFNYIKIQDKIGAKLFRQVLLALREIPDCAVPIIDMLNLLEKLNIIENSEQWDMLREVRNIIAHEYPADLEERIDNIKLALSGFDRLKRIYASLQVYVNARAV
jgi:hypothetical protein